MSYAHNTRISRRRLGAPKFESNPEYTKPGPVTTYKLSQEELSKYFMMPGSKGENAKESFAHQQWIRMKEGVQVRQATETQKTEKPERKSPVISAKKHEDTVERLNNRITELTSLVKSLEEREQELENQNHELQSIVNQHKEKFNLRIHKREITLLESVSIAAARAVLETLDVDYEQKYHIGGQVETYC